MTLLTSEGVGELVLGGNLLVAVPIAIAAGLISFASPCVLPLVPGYLGFIGGFDSGEPGGRRRLLLGVLLFILGFSIVFVLFGVLFGTAGLLLKSWLDVILRVAGIVLIVMGAVFIGQVSFLQRTFKPQWKLATGLAGAPLLGIVFALGWTPCLGPTLIAVNSLALESGNPARGALLAVAYCLGLGIPFLLVALGLGWVHRLGRLDQAPHPRDQHHRRRPAHPARPPHGDRRVAPVHHEHPGGDRWIRHAPLITSTRKRPPSPIPTSCSRSSESSATSASSGDS